MQVLNNCERFEIVKVDRGAFAVHCKQKQAAQRAEVMLVARHRRGFSVRIGKATESVCGKSVVNDDLAFVAASEIHTRFIGLRGDMILFVVSDKIKLAVIVCEHQCVIAIQRSYFAHLGSKSDDDSQFVVFIFGGDAAAHSLNESFCDRKSETC